MAADTLEHGPLPPDTLALLVSGGHTQLLRVGSLGGDITELGSTVDDAAGEAYDKVARLLGLGYPGGPVIDELAGRGDGSAIAFPRGMTGPRDAPYAYSFSGLKTAVARYVEAERAAERVLDVPTICASFQEAVVDVLTAKMIRAAVEQGPEHGGRGRGSGRQRKAAHGGAGALRGGRAHPAGAPTGPVHRQRGHDRGRGGPRHRRGPPAVGADPVPATRRSR